MGFSGANVPIRRYDLRRSARRPDHCLSSKVIYRGARMSVHQLKKPYLLLVGDMENPVNAKTALGLRDWNPQACIGQLRFNDKAVDLGLPEMSPAQAAAAGAK